MPALRCGLPQSASLRAGGSLRPRRACRTVTVAAEPKQSEASPIVPPAPPAADEKPTIVREFTSFGARIIETDARLSGPEDQPDMFEGENMETLGKVVERFFLPGLVVLGLVVGGFAARTYNDDADVFIAQPTSPTAEVVVIPAGALSPAPVMLAPATSD